MAETMMEMRTPAGIKKVTVSEAIMYSIAMHALKGKLGYTKLWQELEQWAVEERKRIHPTILVIEYLQRKAEDARFEPDRATLDAIDAHIEMVKGHY